MSNRNFTLNSSVINTIQNLHQASHASRLPNHYNEQLYLATRYLYYSTRGEFNSYLSSFLPNSSIPNYFISDINSSFDHPVTVDCIDEKLLTDGYFTGRLKSPAGEYSQLISLIDHHGVRKPHSARTILSNLDTLLKSPLINFLIHSTDIKAIADRFLRCNSILNSVLAWKTSQSSDDTSYLNSDALLFHRDLDHNKFLKVFIYLSDVSSQDGPHVYVPSTAYPSQRSFPNLDMDRRFSNLEIVNSGLVPKYVTGSAGTIFFANTQNFHRGTPIRNSSSSRYLLQLQFVDSWFGATCPYARNECDTLAGLLQ